MLEKWQRSISEADKRILSCLLTSFVQAYFLFRVVAHPTLAAPVADRWAYVISEVARAQNAELIVATSTTWAKEKRSPGTNRKASGSARGRQAARK